MNGDGQVSNKNQTKFDKCRMKIQQIGMADITRWPQRCEACMSSAMMASTNATSVALQFAML